jgi:hypothetical protein
MSNIIQLRVYDKLPDSSDGKAIPTCEEGFVFDILREAGMFYVFVRGQVNPVKWK